MCGLGLALAPCFWVGVYRKIVRFHHYSMFRELQKKQKLFFPMLSWVLFTNTPDGWSIGFEVPHMCAVHLDLPRWWGHGLALPSLSDPSSVYQYVVILLEGRIPHLSVPVLFSCSDSAFCGKKKGLCCKK